MVTLPKLEIYEFSTNKSVIAFEKRYDNNQSALWVNHHPPFEIINPNMILSIYQEHLSAGLRR